MTFLTRKKILYAILTGSLLTASFPPGKLEWISWFALVPLFMAIYNESRSNSFKLGMIAGITHYLTLIYWIIVVLNTYGGLDYLTSSFALIILSLYLSLYLGIFSLLVFYIKKSRFQILLTASLWVSLEYIRAIFITGFPWCLLGYSQFKHITLIQITDLVGVYGLSFLIVAVNVLLYFLLFSPDLAFRKKILKWDGVIVLLMLIITMLYGHFRLQGPHPSEMREDRVKAAIIQGNIDQSKKWDPEFRKQTIDRYRSLTISTRDFKPNLVVWPETSVPLFFQKMNALSKIISHIPTESDASLVFGCPAYEMKYKTTQYFTITF